jgi:citrate lyase beta subunit
MSFEQIRFWAEVSSGILPVIVKIGGPNARNDIKQLMGIKVDGFIAPMVESAFGLKNFMEALSDYTTPIQFEGLDKHINIETVTAMENLQSILDSECAVSLNEITIGSHDLSRSMNKPVNHPAVLDTVKQAAAKIRARKIAVSVGGSITPASIDTLLEEVRPQKFNTRIVTFDVHPNRSYRSAVKEAIEFEILMLNNDSRKGFISADEERFRVKQLKTRLTLQG